MSHAPNDETVAVVNGVATEPPEGGGIMAEIEDAEHEVIMLFYYSYLMYNLLGLFLFFIPYFENPH